MPIVQPVPGTAPAAPDDVPAPVIRQVRDAVVRLRDARLRGRDGTADRWGVLVRTAAEVGLDAARLTEAHLDAVTILRELGAGPPPAGSLWGVWAAESRDDGLTAHPGGDGCWRIEGTKPWCSGLGAVTHALVTARAEDDARLFAVALHDPGVARAGGTWTGVGMRRSGTGRLGFDEVPAVPVGGVGGYLARPGFWHGAAGVAAVWYGGAVGALRPLIASVAAGDPPEPHAAAHLGTADAALAAARSVLRRAAAEIDEPSATPETVDAARLRAMRVRATVESAVETTLRAVGRATGPRPLAHDAAHAAHVADLEVYVRQSHAERDLAALGALVAARVDEHERTDLGAGPGDPS